MNFRLFHLWLLPLSAGIVIADSCVKFWALKNLPTDADLINPNVLELAVHKNWGIAFNIPFKMWFIVLVSIVIGTILLWVAYKNRHVKPSISIAALVIVVGACGNLYDRLAYGFTVDYLILFGRSAINFSDIVIITGVVMFLHVSRVPGLHQHAHGHHVDKPPSA